MPKKDPEDLKDNEISKRVSELVKEVAGRDGEEIFVLYTRRVGNELQGHVMAAVKNARSDVNKTWEFHDKVLRN